MAQKLILNGHIHMYIWSHRNEDIAGHLISCINYGSGSRVK